ncbi:ferredoxin--NADP+ reductase/benzoate/toluate 1,2-dioxygenase reductase subunit [Saccharicrinis carchari]|uniref:Ferredoxin--NADP+ reductase/benzoate/toluate 1,2-dioxygenase reductase subunit n=1 Tax=Saccharicrinis carchari TaxID=1168039 RepID=A0A521DS46_SACCC|nr:FAD-binding oxidoreductase [Saccharicrinis carchari]SMO74405.1 ferredoxin--NADP+ reductase/benzoate/toluate 1,2-dioxygenase reductase subunit [Saccharicrinis carchari]
MNMIRKRMNLHEILEVRNLTESTFILRFEKNGLEFTPGQHVCVGPPNGIHTREYSIYSAVNDPYIEILVKEVQNGLITPVLKKLKVGDSVVVEEPVGYFGLNGADKTKKKFLFIATGTGISPFHCMVKSYPELDYQIIHGVRSLNEGYEKEEYEKQRYTLCSSRDTSGDYTGRLTNYLLELEIDKESEVYLCGNCNMIHDAYDILENKGIPNERIHAEVYF